MQKAVLFFLAIFGLVNCTASPSETDPTGNSQLIGASVAPPQGFDWIPLKSNDRFVAFGKTGDLLGETDILSVAIVEIDPDLTDAAFLEQSASAKAPERRPPRFEDAIVVTQNITFSDAQCVRFEGSALNTTAEIETLSEVYESRTGYTCRHPLRNDIVVEFTLTSRSGSRIQSQETLNVAQRFFEGIAFNRSLFRRL